MDRLFSFPLGKYLEECYEATANSVELVLEYIQMNAKNVKSIHRHKETWEFHI